MENNYIDIVTEKSYDYENDLRRTNDFLEIWVIALYIDKNKKPGFDKGSHSHVFKNYNISNNQNALNYIYIYEIYLNVLYNNINKDISIFQNKIIQPKGKEWIKILTIRICSSYYKSDINYMLPLNLSYEGQKII